MKKLYLIGGGGHCAACIDVVKLEKTYDLKGIFDISDKIGTQLNGVPFIGTDADIPKYVSADAYFLITLGQIKTPEIRKKIYSEITRVGAQLATVVSPRAYVSESATIGAGTIVLHDALINANAVVGVNCIVNTKALIEHDSLIGDHCHISTAAVVNGSCIIGDGSFVGSNSVLKEGLNIPNNSVLSAGLFHKVNYE